MKYQIKKEFFPYSCFHPPVWRPLLPLINFSLAAAGAAAARSSESVEVKKLAIPSSDGYELKTLLIEPRGIAQNAPTLVYFHGGGFVMKAAASHYCMAKRFAAQTPCRVLFADYRLSPRYPYPVPFDDCFAAFLWASERWKSVAVGGDSAGGALAAAVCQKARDTGAAAPCFQLLIYPVLDRRMQTESMRLFTDTPLWNSRLSEKMWRWYLPQGENERELFWASPAETDSLSGLPDAYIETAEFDCLRDEGILYARELMRAGVGVTLNETKGTMHGFNAVQNSATTLLCMESRIAALRQGFKVNGLGI